IAVTTASTRPPRIIVPRSKRRRWAESVDLASRRLTSILGPPAVTNANGKRSKRGAVHLLQDPDVREIDDAGTDHGLPKVVGSGAEPGAVTVVPVQIDQHLVGVGEIAENPLVLGAVGPACRGFLVEDRLPGVE